MKPSPNSSLAGTPQDTSSLRPRLSSPSQSSTLLKTPSPREVKTAKMDPLPPAELRERISRQVEAAIVPKSGPLGHPLGIPPVLSNNPPFSSPKPIELLKQIPEISGFGKVTIGERIHVGAASLFTYMRQNIAFTLEVTFPDQVVSPFPLMPMGPVAVVVRYGDGWVGFEIPGWGKIDLLPGEVSFQDVFAKTHGIEAIKLMVRHSAIIGKLKLPGLLFAFSGF